tara:strand:- start:393 stop:599 length:207 start_codon:yes stop_codon:yes gene_type:complete
MTKDEIVFCINCIQSIYPGIWSDTPQKVRDLIQDVYDEDVAIEDVEELFSQRIIEEDESLILYNGYGY